MLKMSSFFVLSALLFSLVSCGDKDGSSSSGYSSDEGGGGSGSFKVIAVSSHETFGDFGQDASSAIAYADGICQTEFGAGYKALLGSSERDTSHDWVLLPDTEYRRQDNTTVIATTTDRAVFSFPLENSISNDRFTIWTGLSLEWNVVSNCGDWTRFGGGRIGLSDYDDEGIIDQEADHNCMVFSNRFYCVEQ